MRIIESYLAKWGFKQGSFNRYRLKVWTRTFLRWLAASAGLVFTVLPFIIEPSIETDLPVASSRLVLYACVLGSLAVFSAIMAQGTSSALKDREFHISPHQSIKFVVSQFWDTVKKNDTGRSAIAFGVHDRLTSGPLKPNSIHAEFREKFICSSLKDEETEVAFARNNRTQLRTVPMPGGEFRLKFGEVVPVTYPIKNGNLRSDGTVKPEIGAKRAYLLVNSSLTDKTLALEPNSFCYVSVGCEHASIESGEEYGVNLLREEADRPQVSYQQDRPSGSHLNTAQHFENLLRTVQEDYFSIDSLIVPLLGTGHSSFTSPTASLYLLIDAFFAYLLETPRGEAKINQLVVSLPESEVVANRVDLQAIHAYVSARIAIYQRIL